MKIVLQRSSGSPSETRYLDFVHQPIKDEAGNVTSIFVEGVDITDRRRGQPAQAQLSLFAVAETDPEPVADSAPPQASEPPAAILRETPGAGGQSPVLPKVDASGAPPKPAARLLEQRPWTFQNLVDFDGVSPARRKLARPPR